MHAPYQINQKLDHPTITRPVNCKQLLIISVSTKRESRTPSHGETGSIRIGHRIERARISETNPANAQSTIRGSYTRTGDHTRRNDDRPANMKHLYARLETK